MSKKQQLTPGPSRGAIFDCDKPDFILKNGPWKGRKLYDLYKATEPPRTWFPELFLHARKIGITIFSSVFSPEDVDVLEQFNPPAYKIASFEITDINLIRYALSTGKPLIISTGMASHSEIFDAVYSADGPSSTTKLRRLATAHRKPAGRLTPRIT